MPVFHTGKLLHRINLTKKVGKHTPIFCLHLVFPRFTTVIQVETTLFHVSYTLQTIKQLIKMDLSITLMPHALPLIPGAH